jgi:alkylation response protein AidB-like acyl-CoA dehydrogenase
MALTVDEREELSRTARQFLDRSSGPEQVRVVVENPGDPDEDAAIWKQIVDMGWTGIHVPEELGGAGAGYDALAVILHEMGRHLTTSPYLASSVLATEALLRAPKREAAARYLPRLVAGEIRAAVRLPAQPLVLDAAGADLLIEEIDSGQIVAIEEFSCTPVPTVDRTRRLYEVQSDGPPAALLAEAGGSGEGLMQRVAASGSIAAAADAAGAAERITELTTEYANNRVQFGKPIGSFQAVKHHCADMVIAVEASRAAVRAAFEALGDPEGEALLAVDIMSSYCGPACSRVCGLAVQVHGGIGFTWEHDAHLFMKRAKLDESLFGTPLWHRRRMAATVFPTIADTWAGRLGPQ